MANGKHTDLVAAVDLGSNSFHLVLGRLQEGSIQIIDRLKETVRLGGGLDENLNLSEQIQERALACLSRFGERLRDLPASQVRAVGTSALRQARNRQRFLERAEPALGHKIEIVRGHEEARLIYAGVAHSLAAPGGRRFVVDIGGGSTECIIGDGLEPLRTDSLHMGCVNFSRRHFSKGKLERAGFERAELAARQELRSLVRPFRTLGFDSAVGSSGTITTIAELVRSLGFSREGISRGSLRKLRRWMIEKGRVEDLVIEGVKDDRAPVLPGGLAILRAVFDALHLKRMSVATGALREGVLFDLAGRLRHEDGRAQSIRRFSERHQVDQAQASRVLRAALRIFDEVADAWELDHDEDRKLLSWAAMAHEVGMVVDYSGYHKHGAYLVAHSDLPGFSADDQDFLAALVLCHRRRIDSTVFSQLPKARQSVAMHLTMILRMAVLLNRGRGARRPPKLALEAKSDGMTIRFPEGWMDRHPLTSAELEEEVELLAAAELTLKVR